MKNHSKTGDNYETTGVNSGRDDRRILSTADRQKIFLRDKGTCQVCGKKLDFFESQIGHKKAWPDVDVTTLGNSVILCYKHHRLQGNESLKELKAKVDATAKSKMRR